MPQPIVKLLLQDFQGRQRGGGGGCRCCGRGGGFGFFLNRGSSFMKHWVFEWASMNPSAVVVVQGASGVGDPGRGVQLRTLGEGVTNGLLHTYQETLQ